MRRWKFYSILTLALALGALGCGSSSTTVTLTIAPTTVSVVTNLTQQFSSNVTGSTNTTVSWALACATNVTGTNACGTINQAGLYTAPATIPTVTSNGTTTPAPTATVTATSAADTTKTATADITIITGIGITLSPSSATVGTSEHFTFLATVTNPGCTVTSNPTCLNVTWSLSTTLTGIGTIDPNTGVYTAPATVPSPSSVTITATSVTDTSVTATTTVNIVTASPPTVTSVSPNTAPLGGLFQDIYITGTNFISTNVVYVNGVQLPSLNVADDSSSLIRARLPDYLLATPPTSNTYTVTVSQQVGTPQGCSPDPSLCNITLMGVRPGVVGPFPDTISQGYVAPGSGGVLSFNVDGGFFGTSTNPTVSATYKGKLRAIQLPASGTTNSTRQMTIALGGSNSSDFTTPGLYPVDIRNATNPSLFAFTNLAVQPNYVGGDSTITTLASQISTGAGTNSAPNDVAINPATGIAVVVNTGTSDITLIDVNPLDPGTPKVVKQSICTASTGAGSGPNCPAAGPTSVSIDYVRNTALVVNATTQTVAFVDLNAQAVTYVTSPLQNIPEGVGVNPVTGRALIAMQSQNYGIIMDETQNPPAFVGIVSISTGLNPRVAVDPYLNWAIATPGGNTGTVSIVDLNSQTTNTITAVSRTTNVVTVTVEPASATQPTLAVQENEAVFIQGISDPSFNGFYTVVGLGPAGNQFTYAQTGATLPDVASFTTAGSVNYSEPVATNGITNNVQGIGINTETQEAILADPASGGEVTIFSLIDQSNNSFALQSNGTNQVIGPVGAAVNSLTNTAVAVNSLYGTLSVIDPTAPATLTTFNLPRPNPVAIAVDPGSNIAVIANQSDNSATVVSLGPIQSFSITETSPKIFVANSTLMQAPQPAAQTITVLGKGLTCSGGTTNLTVRLDGTPLQTFCTGTGDRELTAIAPPSLLSSAHRFALDVADSSGDVTNAEDFLVEQNIDVSSATCPSAPQPSGVAIDPKQNIAVVTLFGCNTVTLIDLANGTGPTYSVGSNPLGVAVLSNLNLAVVANNGSGTASVVDELGGSVNPSPATDSGSFGASADQDTSEVAIANSVANTVSVVNAVTGSVNSISVGSNPVATAFNYVDHEVCVANAGSTPGSMSCGDGGGSSFTSSFSINLPTSIAYDPVPADCNQTNTTATSNNTVGCFIVNSSLSNNVEIIDPLTSNIQTFSIGINPTAIAYNFLTSTLVSTNGGSHTVTVGDFLARKVRAVLPLPAALGIANSNRSLTGLLQFALDIHPFTNIAVIADTVNGRVLFIPIPR